MPSGETKGLPELLRRMERYAGATTYAVGIGTQGTSGSVRRKGGGTEDMSRSAGENKMVQNVQARAGRDFAFLSDGEQAVCRQVWRDAIDEFLRTLSGDALVRGGQRLGEQIIAFWRQHIERSVGRDGSIKPVTKSVQAQKDRETGRPGLPPLVRTGQLLRSLVASLRGM